MIYTVPERKYIDSKRKQDGYPAGGAVALRHLDISAVKSIRRSWDPRDISFKHKLGEHEGDFLITRKQHMLSVKLKK